MSPTRSKWKSVLSNLLTLDAAARALVIAWPLVFYWRAAVGQGLFFFGDLARFFYPTRVAYADALRADQLPLWLPQMLAGFPLFAEMQTGALYPPHLLLYRLLPIDWALNYDILLHLAWLGLGMYACARALGLRRAGALLAALVISAGGFGAARVTHPNVLATASWLPWLIWAVEKDTRDSQKPVFSNPTPLRFGGSRKTGFSPSAGFACLTIFLALQFLAGHPQFALINVLTVGAYVLFRAVELSLRAERGNPELLASELPAPWPAALRRKRQGGLTAGSPGDSFAPAVSELNSEDGREQEPALTAGSPGYNSCSNSARVSLFLLFFFLALLLSLGLAAVQLLPTYELMQFSSRAGGVTQEFFTTFSFHPFYLALLVAPFLLGNPYPHVSVEVVAYLGLLPLMLAIVAPVVGRERRVWFWGGVALVALFLALGGYNPVYRALSGLPPFNFFRVPARFLFPFAFGLAMCAGVAFDALMAKTRESGITRGVKTLLALVVLPVATVVGLAPYVPDTAWLALWSVLPILLFIAAAFLLWRIWRGRISREFAVVSIIGLTLFDLACFGAVYQQTFNQIAPRSGIFPTPRVLPTVRANLGEARILTSEWILPWVAEMNQSLFPSLNVAYNVEAASGYTPLPTERVVEYQSQMSPAMLNLMNVRDYLIPQVLPVDPPSEAADLTNPYALNILDQPARFAAVDVQAIEVTSFLAQSADVPQGQTVARVIVTLADGTEKIFPLRAGLETAEWAYDRSDVTAAIKHQRPPVASTFPARSSFPIEEHVGHTYLARFEVAGAATGVRVESSLPRGRLHVERVDLIGAGGEKISLAHLVGAGEHALVYRSEDVAVYENRDVLPRAFLVHRARVVEDARVLTFMRGVEFDPRREVVLSSGQNFEASAAGVEDDRVRVVLYQPTRVEIETDAGAAGYLLLADAWYPGWRARVDGVETPIERADCIFRAVYLSPGAHRVEFEYQPESFRVGTIISLVSLFVLVIVVGARHSTRMFG